MIYCFLVKNGANKTVSVFISIKLMNKILSMDLVYVFKCFFFLN